MKFRWLSLCLVVAACGDTTSNPTNQLNLDRPVDVAFACAGGLRITGGGTATADQPIVPMQAMPNVACDIRSQEPADDDAPPPRPVGQEGAEVPLASWYALILQKGPGTLAIGKFPTESLSKVTPGDITAFIVADADPHTPGKNSISIGEEPIGVITDTIGCSAVTANAGSCDLSVMDLTTAFDLDGRVDIERLEVTNGAGVPIRSKPSAIIGARKGEVIGEYCPSQAPGAPSPVMPKGLAYIAYPSCHIVAGVDLETGAIVTGIQFSSGGPPTIITDPSTISCPDECGLGSTSLPGPRPVTIDLEYDQRFMQQRMVIGTDNNSSITVVEMDDLSRPLSLQQIALEGDVGVTALAMSPVVAVGGKGGSVDQNGLADFQYVYAVATDQSVRVLEVQVNKKECDTQVDPRFLRSGQDAATLGCLVVGAPATPPRRAGARGPGISLGKDLVPLSVDFYKSETGQGEGGDATATIGHYAAISASDGTTFIVTVDDDAYDDTVNQSEPLVTPVALVIPHQLRDAGNNRSFRVMPGQCDAADGIKDDGSPIGGPRSASVVRNLGGFIATVKGTTLPGIRQQACITQIDTNGDMTLDTDVTKVVPSTGINVPQLDRDLAYPDWRALPFDENVTIIYEGNLSQDRSDTNANGPPIRESMLVVDQQGIHLRDQTRPYCSAGVEPFDIVQMRGCDPSLASTDCPIGYVCHVHPQSQVQGLGACMLKDEAERLDDACKDFLTSIRRYTVVRADSGELLLTTRRHELRMTPLDGCTSDAQCDTLGDLAIRAGFSDPPSSQADKDRFDTHDWVCRADPTKPPRGVNNKRCNMACDATTDCVSGTVCQNGNPATPDVKEGLCMEGVVPPQSCVNAPQRYELRAGEAFVFVGSRSGFTHPIVANAAGQCVKPPNAHPYLNSRIPLNPPACDPTADPISGRLPGGGYEPNPCSTTVSHWETLPNYTNAVCDIDTNDPVLEKERQAPAIKYRSRGSVFSIVDPYYPGDKDCITDRLGPNGVPLDKIPQIFHGYSVGWRVLGGFTPATVTAINPTLPVKVLRGPLQSIWVVDQGDFLSTSISDPSTRGRVFRFEPGNFTIANKFQ